MGTRGRDHPRTRGKTNRRLGVWKGVLHGSRSVELARGSFPSTRLFSSSWSVSNPVLYWTNHRKGRVRLMKDETVDARTSVVVTPRGARGGGGGTHRPVVTRRFHPSAPRGGRRGIRVCGGCVRRARARPRVIIQRVIQRVRDRPLFVVSVSYRNVERE